MDTWYSIQELPRRGQHGWEDRTSSTTASRVAAEITRNKLAANHPMSLFRVVTHTADTLR